MKYIRGLAKASGQIYKEIYRESEVDSDGIFAKPQEKIETVK